MTVRDYDIETRPCRYGLMSYFKNDAIVSRSLKEYGEWAQAEIEFLLGLIGPRDIVLDIGAFIGTHTLAFAKHASDGGQVFAFEPQPAFFELLKKNVGQNVLPNVQLFNTALSNTVKQAEIYEIDIRDSFNFAGTGIFAPDSTNTDATIPKIISVTSLDQLAIDRCDLMKIDVEGMEISVLKGSRETLRSTRPIVFAECNSLQYGWPIVEFMKEQGYCIHLLNVPAYNPSNFRKNAENFFGNGREAGLVLIPAERQPLIRDKWSQLRLYPTLIPISCLDDLALALLKKPQYKYEIMSTGKAANILGIGFWANETEVEQFRTEAKALQTEGERLREQIDFLTNLKVQASSLTSERDRLAQEVVQFQATIQAQQQALNQKEEGIYSLNKLMAQKDAAQSRLAEEAARLRATMQAQQRVLTQKEEEWREQSDLSARAVSILETERGTLTEELADRDVILNRIYDSHGWKALLAYYKLRNKFLPEGTWRRNVAKRFFRLIAKLAMRSSNQSALIPVISATIGTAFQHEQPPAGAQDARWVLPDFATTSSVTVTDAAKSLDYEILTRRITALRRSHVESLHLKPPTLISIRETELSASAKSLIFSAEDRVEVSIVIPVFNNLKFTLECLTSVMKHSSGVAYEIIVVDDGSTDRTSEVMLCVPNISYVKNESNLGFVHTCNRGAERARGKYVLFLNNDTQVTENWLEDLVKTFTEHNDVGAVGPKILFPDGRLQEAGALVNRDGTSRLIGLFDDPNLPRYNHVREVMYCSGACLLVEASKFKELGGFDTSLAPAYCEDWDLAFRLREHGFRIIYNPKSVIIHHLSVTSNDVEEGFKMGCVIRNQQTLSQKWQREIDNLNEIKLIALFLPQFHPIPENDRWWGKGFTEWTNVSNARPNYIGHYQPHLPADLGFYDLRVEETIEYQAELAQRYGVHGFCYFYYWFAGKRLLDLPLERMLRTTKPNLPFCLCWANENWTRRWDGREEEVLMAQQHSDEDDSAVIRDLMRYMRHANYIRINGKPLLIVYRVNLFPDIKRTVKIWRDLCREEEVGEIYLVMAESFEYSLNPEHPTKYGFDASMEFPPHGMYEPIKPPGEILNPEYAGIIHDYQEVILKYLHKDNPHFTRFRTVMPSWDNTARRQNDPVMFENTSPAAYQAFLEAILQQTHEENFGDERIVFINAWNEWGEGNHIEPDRRYGHGFLEATRNAQDIWLMKREK